MSLLIPMTLMAVSLQGAQPLTPVPVVNAPQDTPAVTTEEAAPDQTPATAEDLRVRIRQMRMNLLLGGDQVRRAEEEAIEFYNSKARSIDSSMDGVASELTEVRANYDVVLDRALNSGGPGGAAALREAQPLRAKISALEAEQLDLEDRKTRVSGLVSSVESRDVERQRLADQVENASLRPEDLGMPMTSIGLAPPPLAVEASAPFDDDALLGDLLERDPRSARRLLFDTNPVRYWERFPLTPPSAALSQAMSFPLPDPPGQR